MSTMSFWDWLLQPVMAQLAVMDKKLDTLIQKENHMASELDDLKASVANTLAFVQQQFTDIEAALAKMTAGGVDPAQVEAQAQAINQALAIGKAELAKLEAALNPPAPPQP